MFRLKNGSSIQICWPSWILGSEMCFNNKLASEADSLWTNYPKSVFFICIAFICEKLFWILRL